jgi:hypothetical protein
LTAEDAAVSPGEVTVVAGAHVVFLAIEAALLALETAGLARSELAGSDALADAVLLIILAIANRGSGLGKGS